MLLSKYEVTKTIYYYYSCSIYTLQGGNVFKLIIIHQNINRTRFLGVTAIAEQNVNRSWELCRTFLRIFRNDCDCLFVNLFSLPLKGLWVGKLNILIFEDIDMVIVVQSIVQGKYRTERLWHFFAWCPSFIKQI